MGGATASRPRRPQASTNDAGDPIFVEGHPQREEALLPRRLNVLPAAGLALAMLGAPLAQADDAARGSSCIDSKNLGGWKSPSPSVIYYRVTPNAVFRLDLVTGSNQLKYSDSRLVQRNLAPSRWLCSPEDFNLRVTDSHGSYSESLIVKTITRLTPDEVAALPVNQRP